jgi:hypothetical protein
MHRTDQLRSLRKESNGRISFNTTVWSNTAPYIAQQEQEQELQEQEASTRFEIIEKCGSLDPMSAIIAIGDLRNVDMILTWARTFEGGGKASTRSYNF